MNKNYKLSIVVTSRNDNHGQNLNDRTQRFVDSVCYQANKNQLRTELIFVEWNPPKNNKRLYDILKFKVNKFVNIKFYEVPYSEHLKIDNSNKIPLFQMTAKNVGIRRAQGEFILATSIDIVFSDNIFRFIKNEIKKNILYRVPRLDVDKNFAFIKSEVDLLRRCEREFHTIKSFYFTFKLPKVIHFFPRKIRNFIKLNHLMLKISNMHNLTYVLYKLRLLFSYTKNKFLLNLSKFSFFKNNLNINYLEFINKSINYPLPHLFTRASGDFTLMDKKSWFDIGGYYEVSYYSWLLDSILLHQANRINIKQEIIKNSYVYHIDHDDGFSVYDKSKLFKKLTLSSVDYFNSESYYYQIKKIYENKKFSPNMNFGLPNGKILMREINPLIK